MSKSKRLLDLMMTVNRKRKFTVKELADEFQVSTRTILRDLQELCELGVPLYSEVGPHGGYQVLNERILPPIAFTEEEAVSLFFASHALRHFSSLPFETASASALSKFYFYMTGDVRDRIDQMKDRFDFVTPTSQLDTPFLSVLLDAAINQTILNIEYDTGAENSCRLIQPVGVYAAGGLWYCPAYCFLREDFRLFRCDRMRAVTDATKETTERQSLDLRQVNLGNWESFVKAKQEIVTLAVELSREGVHKCAAERWAEPKLKRNEDGTGRLEGEMPKSEIPFVAKFFVSLGEDATVEQPMELVERMKQLLAKIISKYA